MFTGFGTGRDVAFLGGRIRASCSSTSFFLKCKLTVYIGESSTGEINEGCKEPGNRGEVGSHSGTLFHS